MRRLLNSARIEYAAPRQARMMGMFGDAVAGVVAIAMRNRNDIYNIDLYPKRDVAAQASADFDAFRMGTPAMIEIGDDMRKFYGMNTAQPVRPELISEAAQLPVQAQVQAQTAIPAPPPVHPAAKATPEPVITAPVTPAQQAANDLKDDYVNHTVGYDVQDRLDNIMQDYNTQIESQRQIDDTRKMIDDAIDDLKPKGYLIDDPMIEAGLFGTAAFLAGGGLGRATAPKEEELADYSDPQLIEALRDRGFITSV